MRDRRHARLTATFYGAYDFWAKARAAGSSRSWASRRTWRPSRAGTSSRSRWGPRRQKDDDVSGAGAYTHMTLLAETTEGMHNLFRLASLASLEGYFRKPRMDRELLARVRQGHHRHHRLPRRRGADQAPARPGPTRRWRPPPPTATSSARRTSSSSSWTTASTIELRVRDRPAAHRQRALAAVRRHQRPALRPRGRRRRARGPALRADRHEPGRPGPVQVRGHRLLREDAGGDARDQRGRGLAGGLRQRRC